MTDTTEEEKDPSKCCICKLPLAGTCIGCGKGDGMDFAHPECYYHRRADRFEIRLREEILRASAAEEEVDRLKLILDNLRRQVEKRRNDRKGKKS